MKNMYSGYTLYGYGTKESTEQKVTKNGWYYAHVQTDKNINVEPFMRFGLIGGYIYTNGGKENIGTYQHMTSPIIYMRSGDKMIAQGAENIDNGGLSIFCKEDNR